MVRSHTILGYISLLLSRYTAIVHSGCVSLLLLRLPKLSSQCYSNGPGNLSKSGSNKEIHVQP